MHSLDQLGHLGAPAHATGDVRIECVPNFSEGRDTAKVLDIIRAMRVDGVNLLDYSLDHDHNRSVVTIAGAPGPVLESAVRGAGKAAELIDLTRQHGVHPRIGAADVIPFVPLANCSLAQCALTAHQAGYELWRRYSLPCYFYEAAAKRPDRALLEDVRRGQFEGLREAVKREVARRPDVGGPELHHTAGACAVGARRFLVAYNVYLDTAEISVARTVAREIRASNGGLTGVKALGLVVHGMAQISMNVTDFQQTSMSAVFAAISECARHAGAKPLRGELIGLLPEAAYEQDAEWVRQLEGFHPSEKIVERRLAKPLPWPDL